LIPSQRLVLAWYSWSLLAGLSMAAADPPWFLAAPSVLALLMGCRTAGRFFGLRGENAVRALAWGADGDWRLRLGSAGPWVAARVVDDLRYGQGLWLLRFATASGNRGLAVDARLQDPAAIRGLARALGQNRGVRAEGHGGGTDTIPPKV
jgi:hypothetical protein